MATIKGTPKKKSRKRAPHVPKTQPHVALSTPSLRAAVRQLLELAVAYEASVGSRDFSRNHAVEEELGFARTAGVLKSKKTLETILTLLDAHQREKKQRAVQGCVAEALPLVCGWLREPQTAALDRGKIVDEPHLRSRVANEFMTGGTELPREALDDLMKLAKLPRATTRRELASMTQNTKVEGALQRRVAKILKDRRFVDCSPDTLFNIRYASGGRRKAGAVKTAEEARALREDAPVAPQELVLYTLLLVADGRRTDLVDEPMAALRAAVARRQEARARGLAEQPQGQSAATTVTGSETGPTSARPADGRSSS